MNKLRTLFFGTPDFSIPTLDILIHHPSIEVVKVITMPDRSSGRGQKLTAPPIALFAKENNLPLYQTDNINKDEALFLELSSQKIDLIIVIAFAQFLSSRYLNLPKLGAFNIHTSLLPKYRGAAPIQYALLNGDTKTGVTIQKMVKEMDAGDIVFSEEIAIAPNETGGQLYTRLKYLSALSTNKFLSELIENRLQYTKQNESLVSFAPTLKKEDGKIDFKNSSVKVVMNKIRGLDPWPGSYCFLNGKRLKILQALVVNNSAGISVNPGENSIKDGFLYVGCLDGILRLKELQLEGKKKTLDTDLINGIREKIIIE
ncbi:MAG: methionyl-tRNA formyltransferase [Bacteriovoracaceae bacterium]